MQQPERQYLSDKALAIFTSCAVNLRVHTSQADGRSSRTGSLFKGRAGLYRFLISQDVMKIVGYLNDTRIAPSIIKRLNKLILIYSVKTECHEHINLTSKHKKQLWSAFRANTQCIIVFFIMMMFTGNLFDNRELRVKILQNRRCDNRQHILKW